MKTDSMNKFDYLFLGSLIVDLFTAIAGWDWIAMDVHNRVWQGGGGPDMQVAMAEMAKWAVAAGFAFNLCLWALISIFRVGFVRIVLALVVALNAVTLASELFAGDASPTAYPWPLLLSGAVSVAMTVAAMYYSFREDSGAWLRREI